MRCLPAISCPSYSGVDLPDAPLSFSRVVSAQLQKSQGRIGRLASKPRQAGERCRMAI